MEKSAIRTAQTIKNNEKSIIWGYDVDGASSTALLKLFSELGLNYEIYIGIEKKKGMVLQMKASQ